MLVFVFNRRPIEATPSPFISLSGTIVAGGVCERKRKCCSKKRKENSMDCLDARLAAGGRAWLNLVAAKEIKIRREKGSFLELMQSRQQKLTESRTSWICSGFWIKIEFEKKWKCSNYSKISKTYVKMKKYKKNQGHTEISIHKRNPTWPHEGSTC